MNLTIVTAQAAEVLIDSIQFETPTLTLTSGEVSSGPLPVVAMYNDGTQGSANSLVRCVPDVAANGLIDVTDDCRLAAWFPGEFTINVELTDANLKSADFQAQSLTVTVNAINLGTLADGPLFTLDQVVNTSAVAYEIAGFTAGDIYKVKLNAPALSTFQQELNLNVLSRPEYGFGCRNLNSLEAASVACGIRLVNDKLYVFIESLAFAELGTLDYTLSVEPDADILSVDGDYLNETYKNLPVGTTVTGHVGANNYGMGINNVSLYKTDTSNGMDPNGGDYTVSVIFQSEFYSDDSVVVRFDSVDNPTDPGQGNGQAAFECSVASPKDLSTQQMWFKHTPESNTIECVVPNQYQPSRIEIEVYGNGFQFDPLLFNSLTAAEGEVSYDILISQQ